MIYFLHGDNQTASRQKLGELLTQAKLNKKEVFKLNGLNVKLNRIIQSLEANSLFGQKKTIVIENFFSRLKSKEKDNIVKYFKKEAIVPDVIFWEKKAISGVVLRWLPKSWQFQIFKTPVIIFKFLDSFKPGNTKIMLLLLKEVINQESPEMAFYMLARRIKQLIIALDMGKMGLKGAPWQIGKLIRQSNFFSLKQLKNIYRKLLEIDIDLKTGRSFMPLDWHLDLLIMNL